jgi:1-deoxy-D-xylulose-5-phosphate synthase
MSDRTWKYISQIDSPTDLKKLEINELKDVCQEIRDYLIDTISKTGGHLGASLGTVELTVALHYVFNSPIDQIIWDVGHQAYPHKILTGRRDLLPTIRQLGGLSGFTKISESEYDPFGTGHASTSISAALGIACARDYNNDHNKIIAVIGDGSMTGGLAYEGMNNCGLLKKDIIVVINDNNMSISPNVWAISNYFNELISGNSYNKLKTSVWNVTNKYFSKGDRIAHLANKIQSGLKSIITPGILFEALGFRYFGPFNGHNIVQLVKIFNKIKPFKTPILLHIVTEKGKGYAPAENDITKFHGVTPFDKETGTSPRSSTHTSTYTDIFGNSMVQLAENNPKVIAITAAMSDGTGLNKFREKFQDRFFDVGIAEGHAVTFAAGLALKGYKPVVAIYSTFLQRAFDQIIHDVALQEIPVVFAMDRGGFVGADGPTHHGTFDLSYLRLVPNMVVAASMDENELRDLLYTAVNYDKGPFAIRYPRAKCLGLPYDDSFNKIEIGKGQIIKEGKDIAILAVGSMVNQALRASLILEKENISVEVVNMRFIKPIDDLLLLNICKRFKKIITLEENTVMGGFGTAVLESLIKNQIYDVQVHIKGIPDQFIEHGTIDELYKIVGLDVESICEYVRGIAVGPPCRINGQWSVAD